MEWFNIDGDGDYRVDNILEIGTGCWKTKTDGKKNIQYLYLNIMKYKFMFLVKKRVKVPPLELIHDLHFKF